MYFVYGLILFLRFLRAGSWDVNSALKVCFAEINVCTHMKLNYCIRFIVITVVLGSSSLNIWPNLFHQSETKNKFSYFYFCLTLLAVCFRYIIIGENEEKLLYNNHPWCQTMISELIFDNFKLFLSEAWLCLEQEVEYHVRKKRPIWTEGLHFQTR